MSQTSPKMSEKCPKMCPEHTPKSSEISQKYDKKSLSVAPGIEPGTLRIRLQPLSVSNPIGLIPSQQIGSPWISYVSELETEKVTWAFSKLKKHFSEKQALCLCGICPQGLFPNPKSRSFKKCCTVGTAEVTKNKKLRQCYVKWRDFLISEVGVDCCIANYLGLCQGASVSQPQLRCIASI